MAFTAAQIPHIANRRYPPVLSGALYRNGIGIWQADQLDELIHKRGVDEAILAFSDVSLAEVDRTRRRVEAAGAVFRTYDVTAALLPVSRPCVAVCAVRTGCGKGGVARHLSTALRQMGHRVGVIRHPMPYGNLEKQVSQRFAVIEDLTRYECTIEEMEEYEPHIEAGSVVYAGADYLKILGVAEADSDVLIWDGGNNDAPFLKPDTLVTLLDPLRAGHELQYFPSQWNLDHADVLVVAKSDHATDAEIDAVLQSAADRNPTAEVVLGRSPYTLDRPEAVAGKRVLVVEDGPTTTHGGMGYGAGLLAARAAGAAEIVDPRPHALGEIADAFQEYPHLHSILPALGYAGTQLEALEQTINSVDCDTVVVGTPIDLSRVVHIEKPTARASYRYADAGDTALSDVVLARLLP